MPENEDVARITLKLPRELHRRLRVAAARNGLSIQAYLEKITSEAVDKDEAEEDKRRGRGGSIPKQNITREPLDDTEPDGEASSASSSTSNGVSSVRATSTERPVYGISKAAQGSKKRDRLEEDRGEYQA